MTRTRTRWRAVTTVVAAAATAAGVLAACGGGNSSPTPSGPDSWLESIPDNPAYRTSITVNNLHKLWTSAGLSFPPTAAQTTSAAGRAASDQLVSGSPIGSGLLATVTDAPDLMGYSPFAVDSEVAVGSPPDELSLVQGEQITVAKVGAAMSLLHLRPSSAAGIFHYTIANPLQLPGAAAAQVFAGVRNLAVFGGNARAATGGVSVQYQDVANLLLRRDRSPSLASAPDVKSALGYLDGTDVTSLGTSLVVKFEQALGPHAAPAQVTQFARQNGLDNLPAAPRFAGYGYLPGKPMTPTVVTVAIYPNGNDAKAAARVIGNLLRTGTSPEANEPFSRLFAVDKVTTHGDTVVIQVTEHTAGTFARAVETDGFPLFWSPPASS